jgi:hypothetical protein
MQKSASEFLPIPSTRQYCFVIGTVASLLPLACTNPLSRGPVEVTRESWDAQGLPGTHLATSHFDLYTTVDDAELLDFLPHFLEAAYGRYVEILPPNAEPATKLQTYLFATQRQWDSFTRRRFPSRYNVYSRIQMGGFSEGDTCVVYYLPQRGDTLAVIAHEGMHQYFGSQFQQRIPAWLNEGLACYCEGFDIAGNKTRFSATNNRFRINALRDALRSEGLLDLTDFLSTNAGKVIHKSRSRLTRSYYAQAWALIAYLRDGAPAEYRAGLKELLEDVRRGDLNRRARATRVSSESASRMSFGEAVFRTYVTDDLEEFDLRFREYARKLAGF